MKKRNATTYTFQVKGSISNSTIRRLKAGKSVSTDTLETLLQNIRVRTPEYCRIFAGLEIAVGYYRS